MVILATTGLPGLHDQTLNRDSIYHRHGGDFQGIINHLDYLQELGVTTLWMTPVLENDMPDRTEHGYAFTNHYKIETRFGGDTAIQSIELIRCTNGDETDPGCGVQSCRNCNILRCSDPPMKDWLHQWPTFTQTNYKDQTLFDPHGAISEEKRLADGWFTTQMPDLNQSNPYVANFLIQHAIWSVEDIWC